jgi:hypothetical protein
VRHNGNAYNAPVPAVELSRVYFVKTDAALLYCDRDMANPKYAASDKPVPVAELVDTLSDGTKVKRRIPRMRACNEKDEKGKLCAGHLKRWYFFSDEVKQKFGLEIYRCEHCKTLYLPPLDEEPRSGTLTW